MVRLLLLEDETVLREELTEFFAANQYQVEAAPDLKTFWRLWLQADFDIAIIDLGLPDGDGMDLIRELRSTNSAVGVIVYTARVQGRMLGMSGGADHYLIKPMRLVELLAYVSALARRICGDSVVATWRIDSVRRELTAPNGAKVALSAQDFLVLRAFMQEPHSVISRRRIVMALNEDYLQYDQRRLDTQIRRLRVKTEEQTGHKLPVNTVHGVGYQFSAKAEIKS